MSAELEAEALLSILARAKESNYIGEPVSQLEHALQCAELAAAAGGDDELILAALFHDLGHLCAGVDAPQMAGLGVVEHERIGAGRLRAAGASERVARLVEGHVLAKRYLTFRSPEYLAGLSEASQGTLVFQGGPMSATEAKAFESHPSFTEILRLRVFDERAKAEGLTVPELSSHRSRLIRHLQSR